MDFLGISYLHLSPFRYFTSVAILENCYNFLDELNYIQYEILPNGKNRRLSKYDNELMESNIISIHKSKISK